MRRDRGGAASGCRAMLTYFAIRIAICLAIALILLSRVK
jgi:LSD1 subclass zinc finger protein